MDKRSLSERDICSLYISPAVVKTGWEPLTQIREEVGFTLAVAEALQLPSTDTDRDGWISADDVFAHVDRVLADATAPRQRPDRWRGAQRAEQLTRPVRWVQTQVRVIPLARTEPHVFLCYSSLDDAAAQKLRTAMEAHGNTVWMDVDGIEEGEWPERVRPALDNARAVVFLATDNAFSSKTVKKELLYAVKNGIKVLPVVSHGLRLSEVPGWFQFSFGDIHRYKMKVLGNGPEFTKLLKVLGAQSKL